MIAVLRRARTVSEVAALQTVLRRAEPAECMWCNGAPVNRGAFSLGDRVRCHADCGFPGASPFEGQITQIRYGFLNGWYEMSGYPGHSEIRVHEQELERLST